MSIKRYVLVSDFELVTTIIVDKEPRNIAFKNGSRHAGTRGFFTTDIKAEQEAIEKSGGFGGRYKLESETEQSVPKKVASAVEEKAKAQDGGLANTEHGSTEDDGEANGNAETPGEGGVVQSETRDNLLHDNTVTSKNKAISFLQEKCGAKFSQTTDIATMKIEALTGYNLVFDSWK